MIFDWILRGGTVIDGSGKEGFLADVGILDGKIAAVGDLSGYLSVSISAMDSVIGAVPLRM